jgi:glycosyltransferase involved in cell wall biosynthesis
VLNSHRWLHARLTEDAQLPASLSLVDDPRGAELVLYPVAPWPDPQAPQQGLARALVRRSRLFLFSQQDHPRVWAPGVFASVSPRHRDAASVRGGFFLTGANYEPEHIARLTPRPLEDDALLWSFVGTTANCPAVREPLFALADERSLVADTSAWNDRLRWQLEGPGREQRSEALASYADSLHRAKFIVCPRGFGSSSVRLFEAMRVGRCPVILSDDWLAPPLIDWDACAIRIPQSDLTRLPAILREREGDASRLGSKARAFWEQRYSPEAMLNTLVESCLDIPPARRGVRPRAAMLARTACQRESATALKRALVARARSPRQAG